MIIESFPSMRVTLKLTINYKYSVNLTEYLYLSS